MNQMRTMPFPNPDAIDPESSAMSAPRAWCALVLHSFQRHWRVRQMGWVSLGLLALVVTAVFLQSNSKQGWDLPDRRVRRAQPTYRQYAEQELLPNRYDPLRHDPRGGHPGIAPLHLHEVPSPFHPVKDSIQSLILSIPYAVLQSQTFLHHWGYMTYSRVVILGAFLAFVLPLFTLSYATAAFGTERESRSLVWLMTRPIPRSGIYLAKFLGTLPWCLLFGLGGFAAVCLAGGEYGRKALSMYWPAATLAAIAFSALFHMIGAIFRRPVVVGLVYVFFFEALVGSLPGSLKLLSLTFYARSLMYNAAVAAGYPAEMLEVSQAVTSTTAISVLAATIVGFTAMGMWMFARSDYRDDV